MRPELWERKGAGIRECAEAGMTQAETSRKLGLTPSTVSRYAGRLGITFVEARGRKSKVDVGAYREAAARGLTMHEASEELGVHYATVVRTAHIHGIEFKSGWADHADLDRAEAMAAMYKGGKTLEEIGQLYGVTRERVRQIIKKHHGLVGKDGGIAARADANRQRLEEQRDAKVRAKHGCSYAEWRELVEIGKDMQARGFGRYQTPTYAFQSQRANARRRGIEWNLGLAEWWGIWKKSGKWELRGRGKGYMMCRFGDSGAYEVGNVYIATGVHNGAIQPNNPYRKGHPDFEETIARFRASRPSLPREQEQAA